MITDVSIKNFRSFGVTEGSRPTKFSLSNLTIIVGDNSAGKSNILRALRFATDPSVAGMRRSDFFIRRAKDKVRKSGKIEIELSSTIKGKIYKIVCHGTGTDIKGYSKQFSINGRDFPLVTAHNAATQELLDELEPHRVFVAPTVRDVTYLNRAMDLVPLETRSTVAQSKKTLSEQLTKKLERICRQLGKTLGVASVSVTPALELEELFGIIRLDFAIEDGFPLPLGNIGQGHISKAILKLAELQGEERTICVEEPEIHVHPTGIKSLLETFRECTRAAGRQIIVTTHSPEVVNNTDFNCLLSVRKHTHRSIVRHIDPQAVGLVHSDARDIQETILRKRQRGELFLSKYVLLVEGEYDRLVLEALDRHSHIGFVENDVLIVDMGSKNEFAKYHKVLRALDRPYAVLVDTAGVFVPSGSTFRDGVVMDTLIRDKVIHPADWNDKKLKKYAHAKPAAQRSIMKRLSDTLATKGIVIISHGHKDISGAVNECIENAPPKDLRKAHELLRCRNTRPSEKQILNTLKKKVAAKSMEMIRVVSVLPEKRMGRITRAITSALGKLR